MTKSIVYVSIAVVFLALAAIGIVNFLPAVFLCAAAYLQIRQQHIEKGLKKSKLKDLEAQNKKLEHDLEVTTEGKLDALEAFIQETDRKLNPQNWIERKCARFKCYGVVQMQREPDDNYLGSGKFKGVCDVCKHHAYHYVNITEAIEKGWTEKSESVELALIKEKVSNTFAVPATQVSELQRPEQPVIATNSLLKNTTIVEVPLYSNVITITISESPKRLHDPPITHRWDFFAGQTYKVPRTVAIQFWQAWNAHHNSDGSYYSGGPYRGQSRYRSSYAGRTKIWNDIPNKTVNGRAVTKTRTCRNCGSADLRVDRLNRDMLECGVCLTIQYRSP
jgi:hypothetical protein